MAAGVASRGSAAAGALGGMGRKGTKRVWAKVDPKGCCRAVAMDVTSHTMPYGARGWRWSSSGVGSSSRDATPQRMTSGCTQLYPSPRPTAQCLPGRALGDRPLLAPSAVTLSVLTSSVDSRPRTTWAG